MRDASTSKPIMYQTSERGLRGSRKSYMLDPTLEEGLEVELPSHVTEERSARIPWLPNVSARDNYKPPFLTPNPLNPSKTLNPKVPEAEKEQPCCHPSSAVYQARAA